MPSPEEQAYSAVERSYGQGDFSQALVLAEALRPQLQPQRSDRLDQRLQLLIGHIHLYGLAQPQQAEAAYRAVLESCNEPSYRQLAEQGLQLSSQPPAEATATAATPWMQQLPDPQAATAQPVPAASPQAAAPWLETTSTNVANAAPEPIQEPIQPEPAAPPPVDALPNNNDLDRGLLLVRLSSQRLEAAAAGAADNDPIPEPTINPTTTKPPRLGGIWARLSWQQPNGGGGSGR
jgi:hypothetical protein